MTQGNARASRSVHVAVRRPIDVELRGCCYQSADVLQVYMLQEVVAQVEPLRAGHVFQLAIRKILPLSLDVWSSMGSV